METVDVLKYQSTTEKPNNRYNELIRESLLK